MSPEITSPPLYPLLFEPALKHYVWGGRRLAGILPRPMPEGAIAESWEISAHPDGPAVVCNGPLAGRSTVSLHEEYGTELTGTASAWALQRGRFPFLVKLLDAADRLSVQVHPPDAYAAQHEGGDSGKSEMWVVLWAGHDAKVALGVKRGTTREHFARAARAGSLESFLHFIPARAGDFFCVPSGSLHAILGDVVIAEFQQSSNITYRVYDWGRDNPDRPLHLERALDVIDFGQVEPLPPEPTRLSEGHGRLHERLCQNPYFTVERLRLAAGQRFEGACTGTSCEVWGVIEGRASLAAAGYQLLLPGVTFTLLPAVVGAFAVEALEEAVLLRLYAEEIGAAAP